MLRPKHLLKSFCFVTGGLFMGSVGFASMMTALGVWTTSPLFAVVLVLLAIIGLTTYVYLFIQQLRWTAKEIEEERRSLK